MTQATEKIAALLARLEQSGAEPRRLEALRCTQRFKRSWVELAQLLVELRRDRAYEAWGYDDFHRYCNDELHLRRATVDKLTASFSTLERFAPAVLKWDGVEREVPTVQAVDYFKRAVDAANKQRPDLETSPPPRELIKDLRRAVFDEGQPVAELRRRFDPILRPKPEAAQQLATINRALGMSKRLAETVAEVEAIDPSHVQAFEQALGAFRQELERAADRLKADKTGAKAS